MQVARETVQRFCEPLLEARAAVWSDYVSDLKGNAMPGRPGRRRWMHTPQVPVPADNPGKCLILSM
jgi:hypothetical protein